MRQRPPEASRRRIPTGNQSGGVGREKDTMDPARSETEQVPAPAGWYSQDPGASRPTTRYWDGATWKGRPRRAGRRGATPRDVFGIIAVPLVAAGFLMYLASIYVGALREVGSGVSIAGFVVGICGFLVGRIAHFRTPYSLAAILASIVVVMLGICWILVMFAVLISQNF